MCIGFPSSLPSVQNASLILSLCVRSFGQTRKAWMGGGRTGQGLRRVLGLGHLEGV